MKEIHDRIDKIDKRITFINHELGVVIGKLSVVQYMLCGITLGVFGIAWAIIRYILIGG